MSDSNRIAATAALLGDPARANMLAALMDGRALTAKELAYARMSRRRPRAGTWRSSPMVGCWRRRNRGAIATTGWPRRWSATCWRA